MTRLVVFASLDQMIDKKARIVSLVPSWTETLIAAELNVVGRTRFCLHPASAVLGIPVLGGTKGVDIQALLSARPDFVLLDREENTKSMATELESHGIQTFVSHVVDLQSAAQFLSTLADSFSSTKLQDFSRRYMVLEKRRGDFDRDRFFSLVLLDGAMDYSSVANAAYVIWKNPFMMIGKNTFIANVLSLAGVILTSAEKYPQISDEDLRKKYCLFSSEPFPFGPQLRQLQNDGFKGVLVDGEKISWYGIRNLNFLEQCLK